MNPVYALFCAIMSFSLHTSMHSYFCMQFNMFILPELHRCVLHIQRSSPVAMTKKIFSLCSSE